ncbi:hypothetical protein C8J56DRAFT_538313 [Mycena floridula]|nr:hypothetical protein C8J56DRAFT_538313 [Mycena floridula]
MPQTRQQSLIPKGYTFAGPDCMVSEEGKEIFKDICTKANNRLPEAFDMYIYNDYFSYGVLDLIDKTLSVLHNKHLKKQWDQAMPIIEGLTLFMSSEWAWTSCDDGERVLAMNEAYGAVVVAILRALHKQKRLTPAEFPSLEHLLRNIADLGKDAIEYGCDANYHLVCRAIGWRLFSNKAKEIEELEKARAAEWLNSLPEEDQEYLKAGMDEEQDDEEAKKSWFQSGEHEDENERHSDLSLTRVWKEYRDLAREETSIFQPAFIWDLTEWTDEEKKPYLYSADEVLRRVSK